jgi:hypothetical protein
VGTPTALLNLGITAAAWAYNAGLKATVWSGLMYVIGFGPVPAIASSAAHRAPDWWAVGAAATLGLGGHFTNVLADLDADLATGVRGLPQRIAVRSGAPAVRVVALVLLVVASVMAVLAGADPGGWPAIAGLAAVALLAVVGLVGRGRTPFRAALGIALVDVALLVLSG